MKTLTTLILSFFLVLSAGCSVTGQARAADDGYFSQAELDSMLAPVALYPDSVLSHVLIAATYPLEVIQAARWSREHPGLRGEDAVAAVEYQDWDASVKALVAFPDLLQRMDEDLQWTQDLGDAFLVQEADVIASIQYLRSEAYSQGHLRSNDRVKVVREREYIYIEPARTRVVYVPYYDPRVIYTNWRWSSYRPHYWHHPVGYSVGVSFHWGHAYHIRPSFYFSSFHWPTRKVVVVNHHHHYYNGHRFHSGRDVARFSEARHWRHDPTHRRGVSYRGQVAQTRFVDNARPASARVERSSARAVARSDKREWAAQRRSSTDFDRRVESRSRASATESRVERATESRLRQRSETRAVTRGKSETRSSGRGSERATLGSDRGRTVSGSAPARSESRSRAVERSRSSSTSRAGRVSESLRSRSSSRTKSSRTESISGSRSAGRSSNLSSRGDSSRAAYDRGSRSSSSRASSSRSSVAIPRDLTVRSNSGRERGASAPSRSSRASAPSRSRDFSRGSSPSRESTPSRSRSGGSASAPARSAPPVRSSAPSRSSKSAPSRSSRNAGARSRSGGSRGDGRGGEDRR
jgi:hypothetical protein